MGCDSIELNRRTKVWLKDVVHIRFVQNFMIFVEHEINARITKQNIMMKHERKLQKQKL